MSTQLRAKQRKHLMGGSLKTAMAEQVRKELTKYNGHRFEAAHALGVSIRTLEKWLANWDELKGLSNDILSVIAQGDELAKSKSKKKPKKKKGGMKCSSKKTSKTTTQAQAA